MDTITFKRVSLIALLSLCAACNTPEDNLAVEKKKAEKSIATANQNVENVRDKSRDHIKDAHGAADVEKAKIEATKNIAEAKRNVEDRKVDATHDISVLPARVRSQKKFVNSSEIYPSGGAWLSKDASVC